jgi:anti-sigma B factor antagonist
MSPAALPGWLDIEPIGDVLAVRFTARQLVDEDMIGAIGSRLIQLVDQLGYRRLVLNLGPVNQLGSAMVGKLIALHRKVQAASGRLALCALKPDLYNKIFEVLKLSEIFHVYDDEQQALQDFPPPGQPG